MGKEPEKGKRRLFVIRRAIHFYLWRGGGFIEGGGSFPPDSCALCEREIQF